MCIGDELLVWYGDEYAVELGIENEVGQQEQQPWFDKSMLLLRCVILCATKQFFISNNVENLLKYI